MLPRLINYDQPNSFRGQNSRGRCSKKEEARLAPGFSTRLTSRSATRSPSAALF
jgi:hypothetical protein